MSDDKNVTKDTYTDAATTPTRSNIDDTHLTYDPDSGFAKTRTQLSNAKSHADYEYEEFVEWRSGRTRQKRDDDIADMEDTIF